MSKKRYVDTRFWDDEYIINLDPSEKLLFLYFLTNTLVSLCGIYEISIKRMSFDTGIKISRISFILDKLEKDKKIYYIDGYIFIKNYDKYQYNNNPKVISAKEKEKSSIPEEVLTKIYSLSTGIDTQSTGMVRESPLNLNLNLNRNLNLNSNADPANEKQEAVKFTPKDKELTDKLISKVRENYPFLKEKTDKQIEKDYEEMNKLSRIDGYTYEQIEFIIKFSQEDKFWKQNIRSVTKLRDKFEELVVKAKSKYTEGRKIINV